MGRGNFPLQAFNRGEIGRLALGRVDVDRLRLSAEEMVNFVPHAVGPMQLRPGLAYTGHQPHDNARARTIPFVYSMTDRAMLECTSGALTVLLDSAPIQRPAVASTFSPGDMITAAGWLSITPATGICTIADGVMSLNSRSIGEVVKAWAPMTIASPGVGHALRIVVEFQPVTFRVGTTNGVDDVFPETVLNPGTYSLAFATQASTVWVQFDNPNPGACFVRGAKLEGPGPMVLSPPWVEADLPLLRFEQSGNLVYVACVGHPPLQITRYGPFSWGISPFYTSDGPFQAFPTKQALVSVDGAFGQVSINADRDIFRSTHVGALMQIFTPGYFLPYSLAGANTFTPPIRVTNVQIDRQFGYEVSGTFVGAWELQRSVSSATAGFVQVATGTGPISGFLNDGLDNSICWYRIGFTNYTSGALIAQLKYGGGGRVGVAKIYEVLNGKAAHAVILIPPSSDRPTDDWRFGDWSNELGWPSSVGLYDGRLCFAGRDRFWASVSDSYASFAATIDGATVGDASSISRSVGYGPVAVMNWLLPLSRLIIGAEGSEISVRSSALDAPITPAGGITIKDCSTQGSARVAAVKVDKRGLFVQRSGQKLYQLAYDVNSQDYEAANLNRLHPELFLGNPIVQLAVQRQPDTRVHCLRADGTVAVLTFEPADEVEAWWRIETDGFVENICVLPDAVEDQVFYTVRRTIAGDDLRLFERFARLDQARGGPLNRMADAHVIYQGNATATIGGLAHLEGRNVIAWGDGQDLGTFTVAGGSITLPAPVSKACVGLGYEASFKSAKLAYAAQGGTALNQVKRVVKVGLILADVHARGLQYGRSFDELDDMPWSENGEAVDEDAIHRAYDEAMIEFPGDWSTDERLCLRAQAPRPCTVMACSIQVETNG